jgi:hypothetical protein
MSHKHFWLQTKQNKTETFDPNQKKKQSANFWSKPKQKLLMIQNKTNKPKLLIQTKTKKQSPNFWSKPKPKLLIQNKTNKPKLLIQTKTKQTNRNFWSKPKQNKQSKNFWSDKTLQTQDTQNKETTEHTADPANTEDTADTEDPEQTEKTEHAENTENANPSPPQIQPKHAARSSVIIRVEETKKRKGGQYYGREIGPTKGTSPVSAKYVCPSNQEVKMFSIDGRVNGKSEKGWSVRRLRNLYERKGGSHQTIQLQYSSTKAQQPTCPSTNKPLNPQAHTAQILTPRRASMMTTTKGTLR